MEMSFLIYADLLNGTRKMSSIGRSGQFLSNGKKKPVVQVDGCFIFVVRWQSGNKKEGKEITWRSLRAFLRLFEAWTCFSSNQPNSFRDLSCIHKQWKY